MSDEMIFQTWNTCKRFSNSDTCPESQNPVMDLFVKSVRGAGFIDNADISKGPDINDRFCYKCHSFERLRTD